MQRVVEFTGESVPFSTLNVCINSLPMMNAEFFLKQCARARAVKNASICLASARSAVAAFPELEFAWRELAWALFELRRYEEAGEAARTALRCSP